MRFLENRAVDTGSEKFRIDKWLWAARFFKTRSLAAAAVECGKVLVNDVRIKPAKALVPGDMLDMRIGPFRFVVTVLVLSNKRGSAADAQKLYRETDESLQRRNAIVALLKEQPVPSRSKGRPSKRDRREIDRLKKETC